jgi:hypothetical protein
MMKKRSHQDIIGGQGIALINELVLSMGYIWRETGWDAGIDGQIEIRDAATGEMTNRIIQVQSKATEATFAAETSETFEYVCKESDLNYWLNGNAPVILVRSRPKTREAYWVSLKDYFSDPKRLKDRRILFSKRDNRFETAAKDAIARLAMPASAGLYLGPRPRQESLRSNLLPLVAFPTEYYIARTDIRTREECRARVREQTTATLRRGWVLRDKLIKSFQDLSEEPWSFISEPGTVEAHNTQEWADSEDPAKQRGFVELLSTSLSDQLYPKGVMFSKAYGYYYFRATRDLSEREYAYRSRQHRATRVVFKGYPKKSDPDQISCYRHAACEARFVRFGDQWFIQLTPEYHFTRDGTAPSLYSDEWVSGIKKLEHNESVDGQVVMWAALLRETSMFESRILEFGNVLTFDFDAGLDDDAWLKVDETREETLDDDDDGQLHLL